MEHIWTMLMHKILQNHLLCAFVANLKIGAIYVLYPDIFCDKNLAIRKVFAFCDSGLKPKYHIVLPKQHIVHWRGFFFSAVPKCPPLVEKNSNHHDRWIWNAFEQTLVLVQCSGSLQPGQTKREKRVLCIKNTHQYKPSCTFCLCHLSCFVHDAMYSIFWRKFDYPCKMT